MIVVRRTSGGAVIGQGTYTRGMRFHAFGVVRDDTLNLDRYLAELDGKRVRVTIEAVEDDTDVVLSAEEQQKLWGMWVAHGPQGPLADED